MIIDSHWSSPNRPDEDSSKLPPVFVKATLDGSLKRMDELGISKSVIWGVGRNQAQCVARNAWTAELVRSHPDRFIGFCNVHPLAGDAAIRELERCIAMPEFIGLKLHPEVGQYKMNDPAVLELLRRARDLGLPVVTHVTSAAVEPLSIEEAAQKQKELDGRTPYSSSQYLLDWVEVYDSPRVIAAHFGGIFDEGLQASRITFQTTGASVLAIEYACQVVGVERVIYGSDFPFLEPVDEVDKVRQARITASAREAILLGNARALLGISA